MIEIDNIHKLAQKARIYGMSGFAIKIVIKSNYLIIFIIDTTDCFIQLKLPHQDRSSS